jgi:ketosteroid isomerase-like protein
MTGHIEQIRHRCDQFSRGDIRGAAQDWADDFVWEGGNSAELPMGGTHYGKATALGVLAHDVAIWDEFTMSAFVHVWRWRGDQIIHFQHVTDTLQLAQMLGLAADKEGTAHASHSR